MDLQILSYVGLLTIVCCLFKFAYEAYEFWRVYFAPNKIDFSKFGKWSVVTGCTGGLGECMAHKLASKGQNIILIARNKQKLENVASDIAAKYGVKTKYLVIDFTQNLSIYEKIKEFVSPYDVGVLINNVGLSALPSHFLDVIAHTPNMATDLIRVNVLSYSKMTEILLPGMVQRNRGFILNVSSIAADNFSYSLYGASKSFENYFSLSLSYEFEKSGVIIQSCTPAFFRSNMTDAYASFVKMISREDFTESLFVTLGKNRKTYGCWSHALQGVVVKCVPQMLIRYQIKTVWENYKKVNKIKDE